MKSDDLGDRGQWLFCLLMTRVFPGNVKPLFRPHYLGDKFPVVDFLVDLVGSEHLFFFAQVKSTGLGYRAGKGGDRLRINVEREDVQSMVASPVPVYLFGIDEPKEVVYLLSMNEPRQTGIGGLPTRHPANGDKLRTLWQEVRDFWTARDMRLVGSQFQ